MRFGYTCFNVNVQFGKKIDSFLINAKYRCFYSCFYIVYANVLIINLHVTCVFVIYVLVTRWICPRCKIVYPKQSINKYEFFFLP